MGDARQDPGNTGGRDQLHSGMGSPMAGGSHSRGPWHTSLSAVRTRRGQTGNKYPTDPSYHTFKVAWDLHDKVNTGEDVLHMVSKAIKTSFSRT